jgi:hypothetical protein
LLSKDQANQLYMLWTKVNRSDKMLCNPLNVLHACINHPDHNSYFCDKYSFLIALWINSHFPGSVSLMPLPRVEDLLGILEDQLESIENILELFQFFIDINDLPFEYYVHFRLDELIINQEKLRPLLPKLVNEIIKTISTHPKLVHSSHIFGIIVDRKHTEGKLQVDLSGSEAKLLKEFMQTYGLTDQRFSDEYQRMQGVANIYNFDDSDPKTLGAARDASKDPGQTS